MHLRHFACSANLLNHTFRRPSAASVRRVLVELSGNGSARSGYVQVRFCSRVNMAASTRITSPVFRNLSTPALQKVADIFKEYGYEIRIAGGAVRDILTNILPADIDFATTATPDQMKKMFEEKEVRMINSGGEKHGTVTARVDDQENFEITTLRIDKTCDGRWAEVEFTTDWALDAGRRDLTINSMFLDLDGNLFDYFNGKEDLEKRIVKFVGDPNKRIQEDYLRILRYFRFYGRICPDPDSHDPETIEALRANAEGLGRISGERIWMELRKIVVGRHADAIVRRMVHIGLAPFMGFPARPDIEELSRAWKLLKNLEPKPMTVLSSLFHSVEEIDAADTRLKLSNDECRLALFLIRHRSDSTITEYCKTHPDGDPLVPYKRLYAEEIGELHSKPSDALARCVELLKYRGDGVLIDHFSKWELPKFPINGPMVIGKGLKGEEVGLVINQLKKVWILSDFQKSVEDLLEKDFAPAREEAASQRRVDRKERKRKASR